MGLKSSQERGSRRIVTRRTGTEDFPEWRGMRLVGDPGAVPPNMLRYAENVRFRGGNIDCRDGLAKIVGGQGNGLDADDACVISLADFQTEPHKLYLVFDGCPGISSAIGFSLNALDPEQNDLISRGTYYSTATTRVVVGVFDGRLYVGVDDTLKAFTLIVPEYGEELIDVAGAEQAEKIAVFTGFKITCLREFDGKLFIGLDAGAGASKIATWDGLTVRDGTNGTTADLAAINVPTCFGLWRDQLTVGFAVATNAIKLRVVGDGPGTYTTVAPGAGTVASITHLSYRDNLYITDGGNKLWKYDGTTLAAERTILLATDMRALAEFDGNMYYGYTTSTSHAILGQLAVASFTDAYLDLTAQDAQAVTIRCAASYRGSLYVGTSKVGVGGLVFRSPAHSATGTYTTLAARLSQGDIDQMAVY